MSNRTTILASIALAGLAMVTTAAPSARAADIYDKYGNQGSPYDDPRYADIYGLPSAPPPPRYAEPRYAPPPPPDEPRFVRPYYNDELPPRRDRYGYLRPMTPQHYRADDQCMPRSEIRRALAGEGWRDFEDLELRGATAVIRARRPTGQPYALEVDRCTGDIVHARPLDGRPVPYAWRERYGGRTY